MNRPLITGVAALFVVYLTACGSGSQPAVIANDTCQRASERDAKAGRVAPENPAAFCTCFSGELESSTEVSATGKSQADQFFEADSGQTPLSESDFKSMQNIAFECYAKSQ